MRTIKTLLTLPIGQHTDPDVKGLYYRVGKRSTIAYAVARDTHGKKIWKRLGPLTDFSSSKEIQIQCLQAQREIADNKQEAAPDASSLTLQEAYNQWIVAKKSTLTPKGLKRYQLSWKHLKSIHNVTLASLRLPLRQFHSTFAAKQPVSANRCITLVSAIVRWHEFDVVMPKKAPEQARDRVLSEDEWQRLNDHIDTLPIKDRAFWTLVVCTGQRVQQICQLDWGSIDGSTWRIKADTTKTKKSYSLPLNARVMTALNALDSGDRTGYVFPSRTRDGETNKSGYFTGYRQQWLKICEACNITDATPHDCRRTAATLLAEQGVPMPVVGQILGHAPGSSMTAAIYARARNAAIDNAMALL